MPNFLRQSSVLLLTLVIVLTGGFSPSTQADESLWEALRTGKAAVLIRHALAPGTGDPARFRLEDCATQRNLSEEGRQQARAIGEAFRQKGIANAQVLSSRWCRCLETARLLELGEVEPFPPLDSFFATPERSETQTAELREFLRRPTEGLPRVLVTHQVNITALTGVVPRSGEMVVIQFTTNGDLQVMGRLEPVAATR